MAGFDDQDPTDFSSAGASQAGAAGGFSLGDATAGLGIAGLGIAAFSQMQQSKAQSQVYQSDIATAGLEEQINDQRRQQMNLTSQRQSIQNLRNVQQKQAMGEAAANAGGALFGSGYKGGQAQEAAQGAWNAEGISQNLQIGNAIFNLDNQIDQQKIAKAQAETSANNWSGIGAIGGDIMKAAPALAQLASLAI